MEQTENLGGHVPPVPPWFLRLCRYFFRSFSSQTRLISPIKKQICAISPTQQLSKKLLTNYRKVSLGT